VTWIIKIFKSVELLANHQKSLVVGFCSALAGFPAIAARETNDAPLGRWDSLNKSNARIWGNDECPRQQK